MQHPTLRTGNTGMLPSSTRNIVAMVLNVNPSKLENSGNLFQQGCVIYRGTAQFGTYFDQNYRAAFRIADSYRIRSQVRL